MAFVYLESDGLAVAAERGGCGDFVDAHDRCFWSESVESMGCGCAIHLVARCSGAGRAVFASDYLAEVDLRVACEHQRPLSADYPVVICIPTRTGVVQVRGVKYGLHDRIKLHLRGLIRYFLDPNGLDPCVGRDGLG